MSKPLPCALAAAILTASLGIASAQQGPTRQIQVLPAPGGDGAPTATTPAVAPAAPEAAPPDKARAAPATSAPARKRPGRSLQQAAPAPDATPPAADDSAGAPPPPAGAAPPPVKAAPQKLVKEGPPPAVVIEKRPIVKPKPRARYYGGYRHRPRHNGYYGDGYGGGYGGGGYGGGGYGRY